MRLVVFPRVCARDLLATGVFLLCGGDGAVHAAEDDAFSALTAVGYSYDSNVLRLSDDVAGIPLPGVVSRSDKIARYKLNLGLDTQYSLQKFRANASWSRQEYQRFTYLDHTNRKVSGDWLWQLGSRFDGEVGLRYQKELTSLADLAVPVAEMRTEKAVSLKANYSIHPDWKLTMGLDDVRVQRGLTNLQKYNHDDSRASLGVRYFGSQGNSIGLKAIYGSVDYPNQAGGLSGSSDNSYQYDSLRATAVWVPSGATSLRGSIGFERVRHRQLSDQDYDGLAGRLTHAWRAGKIEVTTNLWQEVSPNSSISDYVLSRGASVAPSWAFSSKFSTSLKFLQEFRDYRGNSIVLLSSPEETSRTMHIGASYSVLESVVITMGYDVGLRHSSRAGRDFRYHAWAADLRLFL